MNLPLIDKHKADFEKAIEHFHNELASVRTGRANPALVEGITVDAYGAQSPLKNIASITVPDARSLAIQPWDRSLLAEVEKAVKASNLGIQPVNDGSYIRLNLPPLNEERRKELVKGVGKQAEAARVRIRGVREEIWRSVQKMVKDKQLTEDDRDEAQEELKKLIEHYNEEIKKILDAKEKEIMTV